MFFGSPRVDAVLVGGPLYRLALEEVGIDLIPGPASVPHRCPVVVVPPVSSRVHHEVEDGAPTHHLPSWDGAPTVLQTCNIRGIQLSLGEPFIRYNTVIQESVPRQCGIQGNEKADELARKGSGEFRICGIRLATARRELRLNSEDTLNSLKGCKPSASI